MAVSGTTPRTLELFIKSNGKRSTIDPASSRQIQVASMADLHALGSPSLTPHAPSSFAPLQHWAADSYAVGAAPTNNGIYSTNANGFGVTVSTAQHLPGKSKSFALSIRAGSTGATGDGGGTDGLFGFFVGSNGLNGSRNYGLQGDYFHIAFDMYIPSSFNFGTNLQDGALKFVLQAFPTAVQTGKDDVHICQSPAGFAFINEFGNTLNNTYPSDRSGTDASLPRDQWFRFERGTFLHSDGNLAQSRVTLDRQLYLERVGTAIKYRLADGSYATKSTGQASGSPSLPTSSTFLESVLLFSYWNGGAPQTQTLYMDNFYTWCGIGSNSGLPDADNLGNRIMGSGAP